MIYIRLQEILDERGLTQGKVAEEAKLRPVAVSEICNNQRRSINRDHLDRLIDYLKITDISELIVIRDNKRSDS